MDAPQQSINPDDVALAQRLRRLDTLPIDTTNLDRMLRTRLPPHASPWRRSLNLAALGGVAALLIASILMVSFIQVTPARASAAKLAAVFDRVTSTRQVLVHVHSLAAANHSLPRSCQCPSGMAMAIKDGLTGCCCISLVGQKVSCLLLNNHGRPVVMLVGRNITGPPGNAIVYAGQTFSAQSYNGISTIQTRSGSHWICLMSRGTQSALLELAAKVRP